MELSPEIQNRKETSVSYMHIYTLMVYVKNVYLLIIYIYIIIIYIYIICIYIQIITNTHFNFGHESLLELYGPNARSLPATK